MMNLSLCLGRGYTEPVTNLVLFQRLGERVRSGDDFLGDLDAAPFEDRLSVGSDSRQKSAATGVERSTLPRCWDGVARWRRRRGS
jgi:hypothetical protein